MTRTRHIALFCAALAALTWHSLSSAAARPAAADLAPQVDRTFSAFNSSTPGCAVGVGVDGVPILARGYGMADLEHDVPITLRRFEAGRSPSSSRPRCCCSAPKPARRPGRTYIPELPISARLSRFATC